MPEDDYTQEHREDDDYEAAGCPDDYTAPDYNPDEDEDNDN